MIIKAILNLTGNQAIRYGITTKKFTRLHRTVGNRIDFYFQDTKDDTNKSSAQINKTSEQKNQGVSKQSKDQFLTESISQQLSQLEDRNQKYKVISRNYNETQVPGLDSRKYTKLNQLQQDIIKTNKFDLMNPEIVPKTGSTNSYVGITEQITEISLGQVKIKGQHEVFLSEIDPENIPADLDIRFDSQKELKVVGKQTKQAKPIQQQQQKSKGELRLQIQPDTIQQKTMSEHMQKEFGMGVKAYKYNNLKNVRRWDIFLSLLFFALIMPIYDTYSELNQLYNTTKAIEDERMKQITQLKNRSFQKVLLENKDFNVRL